MTDSYAPQSGDRSFDVESYDLELSYRVRTNRLEGTAVITAVANEDLRSFALDLVGLRATRVRVDGDRRTSFQPGPRKLRVNLPRPVRAGERFAVEVVYAGAPAPRSSRWGAIGWEELEDGAIVASQPTGAPTWFPCNDRPDDRARYRIALTTDAPYAVAATGRRVSQTRAGARVTSVYESSVPTATYLAAVHVGRYREVTIADAPVEVALVHPPALSASAARAFAPAGAMLDVFANSFGPYPQETCRIVVTADQLEIPLEAQGLVVFGANHLDPEYERLVAHELAHQWFGNSVGIARWQDIWLNEGFACYAEWVWSEASGGTTADELAAVHHRALDALPQDLVISDPGPDLMFDDRLYKRGALTLHALRRTLGDELFFDLLRAWCARHRHGLVTTDDLRELVEPLGAGRLLTDWIDRRRLPRLP
ncbi:MAG: M1 family metallopeptidase [Microbacterium sp.]|uniref:M1 family metallopeptidase n=1 Tax=Microbacterium sp. TaxID=51671 RepID=UPI001ACDC846|nr:M1 family metallopeptidase [Microbacterium sp.]MBN9155161.1 M1 family metallopeptidase [Microbacterium sp.]